MSNIILPEDPDFNKPVVMGDPFTVDPTRSLNKQGVTPGTIKREQEKQRVKFGKRFPFARAWWKRYKLERKVASLERQVRKLQEYCLSLEEEKQFLWHTYMQELKAYALDTEMLQKQVETLQLQVHAASSDVNNGVPTFRRAWRRVRGLYDKSNDS